MRSTALLWFAALGALAGAARPGSAQVNLASLSTREARTFADVADLTTAFVPEKARPGEVVKFRLTLTPKPGCWTYPANPPAGQTSKNTIELPPPGDVIFVGEWKDPDGAEVKASAGGGSDLYYPKAVTWEFTAVVSPKASPGRKTVALNEGTRFQACNTSNCYMTRPNEPPAAGLEVLPGPAVEVPGAYKALVIAALDAPTPPSVPAPVPASPRTAGPAHAGLIPKDPVPPAQHAENLANVQSRLVNETTTLPSNNLWSFLLTAAIWGWISLATPCVFPMIPITVSLFLKQGHHSSSQAVKLSLVYSLTIILVLGISAVALLSVFRELSVNPYMNIALGGLFVFFALSLFGMYDITLPGFLLRYTESKRGAGGYIGTVFGALAFSIVSFTCVAPFLGGFAGMAASGQFAQWELALGGLTFATAFASPFFVLAIFPSLLKKLPRSGGWLDTVKAVMGFLELAAAFKFFRTAEIGLLPRPEYFTYDLVMTAWVVIAVACGVYLLGLFRLPHDDEEKSRVGVPRLLFALTFLGLGAYLFPATLKLGDGRGQRPGGVIFAWVDAFLLPEPSPSGAGELPWSSDLKAALDQARRETLATGQRRFVFVDFTGGTCTNCRLNEQNVFPRPEVDTFLRRYALVQMYTDWVPIDFYQSAPADDRDRKREADANLAFQDKAFGTVQLPLYVILEPLATGEVRVVDVYDEGKINDVPRFVAFLKKPLEQK